MKFCVRCESYLEPATPRFFRGEYRDGVWVRIVEFFCEPCFRLWNPALAAKVLR